MSEPIPRPQVLDPDRELGDDREDMTLQEHRGRAQRLDAALHETLDYAQQLWSDVARARQYLFDSLPPDPEDLATAARTTAPTGPDDELGWQRWQDAYSELTSVLTGPHGDSGMGRAEARLAASRRRVVPAATAPTEPSAGGATDAPTEPTPVAAPEPAAGDAPAEPTSVTTPEPAAVDAPNLVRLARPLALGVLGALAIRGLRPRGGRAPRA